MQELDVHEFELDHDAKVDKYPGVGSAFHQRLLQSNGKIMETPCAVAASAELAIWAAGFASKPEDRERAAKLALAVAVARAANLEDYLKAKFPDFLSFLVLCFNSGHCMCLIISLNGTFAFQVVKKKNTRTSFSATRV